MEWGEGSEKHTHCSHRGLGKSFSTWKMTQSLTKYMKPFKLLLNDLINKNQLKRQR